MLNTRAHAKERIGQLLSFDGRESRQSQGFGPGDIGAVAKLKETRAGDWLAARDEPIAMPAVKLPQPVMAFAMEPKTKGDEDKVFTSLRRLQEEDPTIDLHRDQQTGDQIVAGLSQIHVEVVVDRLKSRFGAEVTLKPPRVPYQETIRQRRQGPRAPQEADRRARPVRRLPHRDRADRRPVAEGDFEFVNAIKGGVIPTSFIPAVEKGCVDAMEHGAVAGFPVKGVRVRVFDGSYHSVDSSEMAFKMAGSIAMSEALEQAGPVLLEPIMLVTLSVPEESVGDVIGDLNSRRGRPQGMEPAGGMTEIKAEVPMAEMLTYAPDLRAITGGQGDYTMEFLRYEEVPGHLAQKVVEDARTDGEAVRGLSAPTHACRRGAHAATLGRPVTRKSISTNGPVVACDVCGRTLLRGEHADVFLHGGVRRTVCELCTPRAAHEGWIREGLDDATVRAGTERASARARCSGACASAAPSPRRCRRRIAAARRSRPVTSRTPPRPPTRRPSPRAPRRRRGSRSRRRASRATCTRSRPTPT